MSYKYFILLFDYPSRPVVPFVRDFSAGEGKMWGHKEGQDVKETYFLQKYIDSIGKICIIEINYYLLFHSNWQRMNIFLVIE